MELLFRDDAYLKCCEAMVTSVADGVIRLDRTVFYPTGGGQPGDSGVLRLKDGREISIREARKGDDLNDVIHIPVEGSDLPQSGDHVTAEIDWDRRYKHMRMHTCLHTLCSLIEADVTGGQVGAEKSRLDFNLPEVTFTKDKLTEQLAAIVAGDHPARTRWITDEELAAQPDLVRTMSVAPPTGYGRVRLLEIEGIDLQPCGGTHLKSTGEIGAVYVAKIENKGRQNRRVTIRFQE